MNTFLSFSKCANSSRISQDKTRAQRAADEPALHSASRRGQPATARRTDLSRPPRQRVGNTQKLQKGKWQWDTRKQRISVKEVKRWNTLLRETVELLSWEILGPTRTRHLTQTALCWAGFGPDRWSLEMISALNCPVPWVYRAALQAVGKRKALKKKKKISNIISSLSHR